MKKLRVCLFMSGALLAAMGPLERAVAVDNTAVVPFGPCINPRSYQSSVNLPLVAPSALDEIKKSAADDNRRLQIGIGRSLAQPIVVNRSTVPLSQWVVLPDGWSVWSAEVGSQGALGLRVHIESLRLPQGVRLIVYDPSNPQPDPEPLTQQRLFGRRDVWTGTIFSETAIVECQVPPGVDPSAVSFVISGVSHLYALPMTGATLKEGTCHNDVTCYPDYAQQASGVARMAFIVGGQTVVCTGCLLAASDASQAYFLTANHCVYDQTIASTIEWYWFYQTSSCNGPPPSLGSVPRTGGGADLLATSNGNDFSFMRLRQSPPSGANPLNWSTSSPSGSETLACIHHPTGAYKRISFGNEIGATGNFWGVRWFSGVTEPGSSGSPLLNSGHEVIGQLNAGFNGGGGSSCTDPTAPDQFGRFDVTYPSIQQWLNASGGGTPLPPVFVKGTYNGLLYDTDTGPALGSAGAFTVVTTAKGKFSGRIQIGMARYSIVGQLDSSGTAEFTVPRQNISGQLQVDPNDSDHITGTISDGNFTSQLDGDRVVFDARSNPAMQAGQYTVVIPSGNDPNSPGGDSYGIATVDRAGHIHVSGALSDGTKFSQAAMLSKDGRWPMYVSLYGNQGLLFSWITFGDTGSADFSGDLTWFRPTASRAKLYPGGFNFQGTILGSQYIRPTVGGSVLAVSDATVLLQGGDLGDSASDDVTVGANSRVTNLGDNKMIMAFSPGNGLFRGAMLTPDSPRAISFSGVVFQKQNTAEGYFLGQSSSGIVLVSPR